MTPRESSAPLDHEALLEIVNGTAVETGEAFFDELVRHLARGIKIESITTAVEGDMDLQAGPGRGGTYRGEEQRVATSDRWCSDVPGRAT